MPHAHFPHSCHRSCPNLFLKWDVLAFWKRKQRTDLQRLLVSDSKSPNLHVFQFSWILLSIHFSNISSCTTDSLMSLSNCNMMRLLATNWNSIFSESSEVNLESTQVSGKKIWRRFVCIFQKWKWKWLKFNSWFFILDFQFSSVHPTKANLKQIKWEKRKWNKLILRLSEENSQQTA